MDNKSKELTRLNFENFLWIVFAFLCFLNIYGDKLQKEYINTNINNFEKQSNNVFTFTLIVTLFIYIYFFLRNYNSYMKSTNEEKNLYKIKVFGSIFLIVGIICLIYFQKNNENFIGTSAI